MAELEWAVNKKTHKPEYIGDIKKRFLALNESQRVHFDKEEKRNYKCQFCGADYTASALDSIKTQAYFRARNPAAKEICKRHKNACKVVIKDEHRKKISTPSFLCSDRNYAPTSTVINELVFSKNNNKPASTTQKCNKASSRTTQSASAKSSALASVVYHLIESGQKIAKYPLKAPGCSGNTYDTIFQYLSNMTENQKPRGTHIFYGCVNYKILPKFDKGNGFFELQLYHFKSRAPFKLCINCNTWTGRQIAQMKKSLEEAQDYLKKRKSDNQHCYIYLFWLGDASDPNRMEINDNEKLYIVSGRIYFRNTYHGIDTIKPKTPMENPVTETVISEPEPNVMVEETLFNNTQLDKAEPVIENNKSENTEFDNRLVASQPSINEKMSSQVSDRKDKKETASQKKWFVRVLNIFGIDRK